jgi:hypothetical protein
VHDGWKLTGIDDLDALRVRLLTEHKRGGRRMRGTPIAWDLLDSNALDDE